MAAPVHIRLLRLAALTAGCLLATGVVMSLIGPAHAQEPTAAVLATRVDDPITPVIADHLSDAIDTAERDGYQALLVELDTPGGLVDSMRSIVQDFLAADVPVIVYVSPSGAPAASAGALIAWSAHIAAMAPGTTIGAATPVDLSGGEVGDKVVNDAASFARAVAEERGRNVEFAEAAVEDGESITASEALARNVVDEVAANRDELLMAVDGRTVQLGNGATQTLFTAGAPTDEYDMSFFRSVLQRLADPNLAFLFLSIGTLGIIYELATPGVGAGGVLGGVMILLALFSIAVLSVDAVGFLFLALAIAMFIAELFAPGIGIFAALGAVALALAGVFLFSEDAPGLSLSLAAVLPTVIIVTIAVIIAGRLAVRARFAQSISGAEQLVGREVEVVAADGTRGQALLDGAWWSLRSERPLHPADVVRVEAIDGIELVVRPRGERDPRRHISIEERS